MFKLLSHQAVYWLQLVLALPPLNGTCNELGPPKIPHSSHEKKPTMKSVTVERGGKQEHWGHQGSRSGLSNRPPMSGGEQSSVYSFRVCAFFLLRSRFPRPDSLVPCCLQKHGRFNLMLDCSWMSLQPWWSQTGSRFPSLVANGGAKRTKLVKALWSRESTVHSRRHDMTLAKSIHGSWERGLLWRRRVFITDHFSPWYSAPCEQRLPLITVMETSGQKALCSIP